jgi:protein-S-isoprenylcysteine O-methyltransferase Ste14
VIFLGILLLHRIGRLEKRCEQKYGPVWNQYKEAVSNRLIPDLRNLG